MDLHKVLLVNEDYILARYQSILKKQNIESVYDLLFNFPTKYDDYCIKSLKEASLDEAIVLEGTVASKLSVNYLKSKLTTVVFTLEVEGERIRCTIFNRAFIKNKINYGTVVRVQGHFYQSMNNFTVNNLIICDEINRNIVPIYKVKDISQDKYISLVEKVYRRYKNNIIETLPKDLLDKYNLLPLQDTIYKIHIADNIDEINKALERIKFEELLQYQLSMKYLHYQRKKNIESVSIKYNKDVIDILKKSLPYELTKDQLTAVNEILYDLESKYPMNRLLQGEVGSGKTVVSSIAILATISSGYQACLMCPTEILSHQHFETFKEIYKSFDINIGLLTGSTSLSERRILLQMVKNKEIDLLIGTHALFQNDVEYHALGLVVTDEEHRFGVHQRMLIKNKGTYVNYLKMSATPIPRTLAISAYGDTDISVIKTLPISRKQVITKLIDESHKKDVIKHMKEELSNNHQIYVVTPLIDESITIDTASAVEVYNNLSKHFKDIATVGLIHGKLSSNEKEEIMAKFLANEIQIMVATSVIEVGVNVANATTIVVLGAERFGVATLHQLRGRVMRSCYVPYCFLVPEKVNETIIERLKMVEETSDGFELAEYDLLHRGPGEFFGEKQSGSMNFKYADILKDNNLFNIVVNESELIINENRLSNPEYDYLRDVVDKNYLMKINELD